MIYKKYPYCDLARKVEVQVADFMAEAVNLSPKKRGLFYEGVFEQVRSMLGIPDSHDELTVYTNINPIKILHNQGMGTIISKISKDPIPLSGDGFCAHDISRYSGSKVGYSEYWMPRNIRPTRSHSIFNLGAKSHLLGIDKKRDLGHYLNSYCESSSFMASRVGGPSSFELNEAVLGFLRSDDISFLNVMVWADSVINLRDISQALIDRSGLMGAYNKNSPIRSPDAIKSLGVLINIMNDKNIGYSPKSILFRGQQFRGDDGSIKEEMFSNLRDLSIWFNKHAGSKAKYLLGDMIEDISTDYILHQNTHTDIRAEMKASLIDTDISELIRPSKLRLIMEYLDLPELISKLNPKEKRRFVSGELGI